MVNRKVPFRTFPSRVCTFVGSTPISRFSSSCRMYLATVLALIPVYWLMRPNAGPALIGFPVFAENQVGVDRQLAGGKFQGEDLVWQKKIVTQRAAVGVSIFNFRGVSSQVIFQNSTPMFQPMSIEKSKFTACSQHNFASAFRKSCCESLFFVYCPANFEVVWLPGPSPSQRDRRDLSALSQHETSCRITCLHHDE